jgi:hypothetical protein
MGTGHSIDTPIRVAPLGISSVISIVDDVLIDRIRKYYCQKYNLDFLEIPRWSPEARAKRITAYLDVVQKIVRLKIEEIKKQPFFQQNEKSNYFSMLPESSPIKQLYQKLMQMKGHVDSAKLEKELDDLIVPGSIDVNIMVKVDKSNYSQSGELLSEEFNDAHAAFRGFANSTLESSVVLSAGINRSLYNYISQFNDFYRDKTGSLKKKIVIKVSDFRSALIQGKFLAMKGLEVSEYRIESGLNCGGHAFASQGHLLPSILQDFKTKRDELTKQLQPVIVNFYKKMGWEYPESALLSEPRITVQGGIGNNGEVRRLTDDMGCDGTGWGSPFLLVPEATCVDKDTVDLLKNAKEEDLYLSNASPLGVPFNNLRNTGSEVWTKQRASSSEPGSPCPKGFLISNTEFTSVPICTASTEFLKSNLDKISKLPISENEKNALKESACEKVCLCVHLGNGALINLGIVPKEKAPQSICPGPNIVWFNREYSLHEMVDHIYGVGDSLVSEKRPHMFAKEIELYVTYLEKLMATLEMNDANEKYLKKFKENLESGMDICLSIAQRKPFAGENLPSINEYVLKQREKLQLLFVDKFQPVS